LKQLQEQPNRKINATPTLRQKVNLNCPLRVLQEVKISEIVGSFRQGKKEKILQTFKE
jgi:hypothetical protein